MNAWNRFGFALFLHPAFFMPFTRSSSSSLFRQAVSRHVPIVARGVVRSADAPIELGGVEPDVFVLFLVRRQRIDFLFHARDVASSRVLNHLTETKGKEGQGNGKTEEAVQNCILFLRFIIFPLALLTCQLHCFVAIIKTRANTGHAVQCSKALWYRQKWEGLTEQPTDWPMDQPTDGRTDPLIEVLCST